MTESHTHAKSDELMVFWVPADTDQAMELKVIPNDMDHLRSLVGGYFTPVNHAELPELPCGCEIRMIVDEEADLKQSDHNLRAQSVYPHEYLVRGNAVFVGEGPVGRYGQEELGWFSLPACFIAWEGPGSPIPTPKQPWEE